MAYDWNQKIGAEPYSAAWFEAIDRSFLYGARLFDTGDTPFATVMPLDWVRGRDVLEIGCGMGFHTETLVRAGARVTSVDLTKTGVEATTRRLALKGLAATVIEADAESLPFPDNSFDFVWSWGVIHHSSNTGRIVREIARVLRPEGRCTIMVYNREGIPAKFALVKHVITGRFMRQQYEETLFQDTDGFSARYYVADQFEDLFRTFFDNVTSRICGQDADALPLPRRLREPIVGKLPLGWLQRRQARVGAFLVLDAAGVRK